MVSGFPKLGPDVVIECDFASAAGTHQRHLCHQRTIFQPKNAGFSFTSGMLALSRSTPQQDEVIASLLRAGLIHAERVDDDTSLLKLTLKGETTAARLRDN